MECSNFEYTLTNIEPFTITDRNPYDTDYAHQLKIDCQPNGNTIVIFASLGFAQSGKQQLLHGKFSYFIPADSISLSNTAHYAELIYQALSMLAGYLSQKTQAVMPQLPTVFSIGSTIGERTATHI